MKISNLLKIRARLSMKQNTLQISTKPIFLSVEMSCSLVQSRKSKFPLDSKNKSSKIGMAIPTCLESSPSAAMKNSTSQMSMYSLSGAINASNTSNKSDSKSERNKKLQLKLLSKFLQLRRATRLKVCLKYNSRVWSQFACQFQQNVRFHRLCA